MRFSFLIIAASLVVGCGSEATIRRANAPSVVAEIHSSDKNNIYVGDNRAPIPRKDIVSISHPGKAAMITGSVMLGVGAIDVIYVAMLAKQNHSNDNYGPYYAVAAIPATIGIITLIAGAVLHDASESNASLSVGSAKDYKRAPIGPHVSLAPMLPINKGPGGFSVIGFF